MVQGLANTVCCLASASCYKPWNRGAGALLQFWGAEGPTCGDMAVACEAPHGGAQEGGLRNAHSSDSEDKPCWLLAFFILIIDFWFLK